MNLFFDEESQKILMDAKKEMYELKHPYVGSEHLLLAILNNKDLDICKYLATYGVTYDIVKDELLKVIGVGHKTNDWFLFTPLLKRIILQARNYIKDSSQLITPKSLFLSIIKEGDGIAYRLLIGMNIDVSIFYDHFFSINDYSPSTYYLDQYGVNLNKLVDSYDEPVIGREKELQEIIQILCRKKKGNPLLIGEAGVGKTAIVEELARRIILGKVPFILKEKIIYSISLSSLVAGTKYRGEFEEKLENILDEVKDHSNIILFIDEAHSLMGAGGAEGAIDAANILKPFLARENIRIIGSTTFFEYSISIKKDKAFDRRFHKIYIEELSNEDVFNILLRLKKCYENYHHVKISNGVLGSLLEYSNSCLLCGKQPDKAVDLLDEVCSYVSVFKNQKEIVLSELLDNIHYYENLKNDAIQKHHFKRASLYKNRELLNRNSYENIIFYHTDYPVVTKSDLKELLYKKVRAPRKEELKEKMNYAIKEIKKTVFCQDIIIDDVLKKISKYDYIHNNSPLVFLFIGKSGVGKTFLAQKIYKVFFSHSHFIHINLEFFQDSSSFCKLLGDSYQYKDGYIFQELFDNPFSIIIIDNIQLGHSTFISRLWDSFKTGYIVNGLGEKIYLYKCIFFLTGYESYVVGFNSSHNELNQNIMSYHFYNPTKDDLISYIHSYYSNYSSSRRDKIISYIINKINLDDCNFHQLKEVLQNYSV